MKSCIFIYNFIIFIFLFDKICTENKKSQKSFDEIFGKGWEEKGQKAKENLEDGRRDQKEGIGKCQTKILQSDQNNYLNKINENPTDCNENGDQIESDQQKREIIQTFRVIKEKIKQKGVKYSAKEWAKIERIIAKKMGTYRTKTYKWIKELGMGRRRRIDESKKYELVRKFMEIKNEYKKIRKYSSKEWHQNYAEISKKIGVSHTTIKKWKKEIGMGAKKITDDQQKREMISIFRVIKEKIKQKGEKYPKKEWNQIEKIIAKKLGTNRIEIYKWIRELGMNNENEQSNFKKWGIIKEFDAMKNELKRKGKYSANEWKENYGEISKKIGVNWRTIQRWKKKFGMSREQKSYTN